jgi:hypothetical protein|tara:strand:- start:2442 stop:2585 length:144 start_codon:yes stop_codon:yes gene_type:complete
MAEQKTKQKRYVSEVHKAKKNRNYAVLFALLGFVVLVFFVSIIRIGG